MKNHKSDCKCFICRAKRGENKGIKRPAFALKMLGKHWKVKDSSKMGKHPNSRNGWRKGHSFTWGKKNGMWKDGSTIPFAPKNIEKTAGRKKPEQCEICGSTTVISFDHDHATGEFRGWICRRCNLVLGLVHDDSLLLEKLIIYLKENE